MGVFPDKSPLRLQPVARPRPVPSAFRAERPLGFQRFGGPARRHHAVRAEASASATLPEHVPLEPARRSLLDDSKDVMPDEFSQAAPHEPCV